MQYSIVGGAIAALLAVIAVVVLSSGDPAAGSPSAATALLEAIVGVDHSKETLTLADLTLTAREQPAAAEQALAKIHAKIKSSPDDSGLHALNAFLLLESGFGARPPSDEQLAEGKKAHEKAPHVRTYAHGGMLSERKQRLGGIRGLRANAHGC